MKVPNKKVMAVTLSGIILLAAVVYLYDGKETDLVTGKATIDDLLVSESLRKDSSADAYIVRNDCPYPTLVATPVALYYDHQVSFITPLLAAGENPETPEEGSSKAVKRFLDAYGADEIVAIGPVSASSITPSKEIPGDGIEDISIATASEFWESSDGAVLVEFDRDGYSMAVNVVPLASYLNIPVIVTDDMNSDVVNILEELDVKYTLVCGDLDGYGKVWKFKSEEEVWDVIAVGVSDSQGVTRSILGDRIGTNATYIALACPWDAWKADVTDEFSETFTGTVKHSDTGSTSFPTSTADAPTFYIDIPSDYEYANVIIDSLVSLTPTYPGRNPEMDGERSYVYFGIDDDEDGMLVGDTDSEVDKLQFFVPSLGYEYLREGSDATVTHGHMSYPIFKSTGKKAIQIKATLDFKLLNEAPEPLNEIRQSETDFEINVTIQKLAEPQYPRIVGASSFAPYLAAYRQGLVMAKPEYRIHTDAFVSENDDCGDPAETYPGNIDEGEVNLLRQVNEKAFSIKQDINTILGELASVPADSIEEYPSLAEHYKALMPQAFHIGIIADTYSVPWYYIEHTEQNQYGASEGYGIPGDNFYADIDYDLHNPPFDLDGSGPSLELAVGRIVGWDVQDISALLARTFFYDKIQTSFIGLYNEEWRASAMNSFGTQVPVGNAKTVTEKLDKSFARAGFTVDSVHDSAASDSKISATTYEKSNFIYFCAHGFYYWFVPPGYKPTSVGGGFWVANAKDMNFGPSVMFASSCVTGKIDGIPNYAGVSQAFLHSGMNAYIGASRLSWGSLSIIPDTDSSEVFGAYLGLLMYGYLTGYLYDKDGGLINEGVGDCTIGTALALAKNVYVEKCGTDDGGAHDDTVGEFNLMGDPAFNPYEPVHQG